jgi:hypothetical protein
LQNKWKLFIYIAVFVVVLNGAGIWAVKSQSFVKDVKPTVKEFTVENVQIKLVNDDGYSAKLVSEVEDSIKQSVQIILKGTNGVLTPNQKIEIHLTKSEKTYDVNRPEYVTSTIFNPDELYLAEFNFNEMMLFSMFNKKDSMTPFQTIGLAEYWMTENNDVVDYYSAHDMWIVHSRHNTPSSLEDLVEPNVFKRRVVKIVENKGTYALPETGYWKVASFAQFLIEKYGVEKFLPLYMSSDVKKDLEKTYGKPFADLEAEWTRYVKEVEGSYPKKYNYDLEEDYKYWYEY